MVKQQFCVLIRCSWKFSAARTGKWKSLLHVTLQLYYKKSKCRIFIDENQSPRFPNQNKTLPKKTEKNEKVCERKSALLGMMSKGNFHSIFIFFQSRVEKPRELM